MIDDIDKIIHLRILVSSLGESQNAGWWKSQFLSPTGLSYLERITPRTKFATAVRSAVRSALLVHDASIGKGQVFHLFRLPGDVEYKLDEQLTARTAEFEAIYSPMLGSQDSLIRSLSLEAVGMVIAEKQGPTLVTGSDNELTKTLAAIYLQAFRSVTKVFPYFVMDS